jgi:hypothetical protein
MSCRFEGWTIVDEKLTAEDKLKTGWFMEII